MKTHLLCLCGLIVAACQTPMPENSAPELTTFTAWISGEWDNKAQVEEDKENGVPKNGLRARYAIRYTPVDNSNFKGQLIAIENYDDGQGLSGTMERVSLHRFALSHEKSQIFHDILFLKDKGFRKSLINGLAPLNNITFDDIRFREDCRLYWTWTGEHFEGATQKGHCVTNSYTDRDITVEGSGRLEKGRLTRHDRNFEMNGTEIKRPGYKSADIFLPAKSKHR